MMEDFSWLDDFVNIDPSLTNEAPKAVDGNSPLSAFFEEPANTVTKPASTTYRAPNLTIATTNLGAPVTTAADPYNLPVPSQRSAYMPPPAAPILGPRTDEFINPVQTQQCPRRGVANHPGRRQPRHRQPRVLQNSQDMNPAFPAQLQASPYPETPLLAHFPMYGNPGLPYFNQLQGFSPMSYGGAPTNAPLTPAQEIGHVELLLNYLRSLHGQQPNAAGDAATANVAASQQLGLPTAISNKRKRGGKASLPESNRARQVYAANLPRLPAWGQAVNGRPLFQYNELGELQYHKTYSASEIRQYLDTNPRPVELWVQQSPPQMKARLGPSRNKCCWACCPAKDRAIETGWLRVGFYEHPEETKSGERDPLLPASQMHLFCFERCFDPVAYRLNGKLEPDEGSHRYPKEIPNKTAIDKASDKNIVDQAWAPWFEGKLPQAQRRPYRETLSYALTRLHLDCQPPRRAYMRDEKNGTKPANDRKTIDYHVGDLMYYLDRSLPVKRSHYSAEDCPYDADNQFQVGAGNTQLTGFPSNGVGLPSGQTPPAPEPQNPYYTMPSNTVQLNEEFEPVDLGLLLADDWDLGGAISVDVGEAGDFSLEQDIEPAQGELSPKRKRARMF